MARVLIAWELGEAFGHLARCLRLAEGLVARGHQVTLALKEVRLPTGQQLVPGISVLAAPRTPQTGPVDRSPINYADVLRVSGFSDAQDVAARLNAWRGILNLTRPDVLVADHAPTALLAARIADIAYLSVGNGFAIPPDVSPWPSIRPWEAIPDRALSTAETLLDRVFDAALKALGYPKTARVRELFGAEDVLDTFVELDHYGVRTAGHYVGPIVSVRQAMRVEWQSREGSRVLAYLRPSVPGFSAILQAFARLDAEVLCVAPGMKPDVAERVATRRLRIALTPVDLAPLLERADLAVGYGNSGFSTQALLAGVPLAMRPRYVEQALLARRVEALGAGRLLAGQIDAGGVTSALQDLLGNPTYRNAAGAFQERHRHFATEQAIEQSLVHIERVSLDGWGTRHAQEPKESYPACLH